MELLFSIAIIVLSSLVLGKIFSKIKLPALLGAMIVGVVFGPYVLDLISDDLLNISSQIRSFALVLILTRAGLSLKLDDVKKIGLSGLLMSFVPACFEILGYAILCTLILKITLIEALLIGSVLSAVSPAVVVPRMISLKEKGYDRVTLAPNLLMASSSVDDIVVIVLFTTFLNLNTSGTFNLTALFLVPLSILLGIGVGILLAFILKPLLVRVFNTSTAQSLIILSIGFLLMSFETKINQVVPFSALISVMTLSISLNTLDGQMTKDINVDLSKLWVFGEIMLFSLVGAFVDISFALSNSLIFISIIFLAILFRIVGVIISTLPSKMTFREKLFLAISYCPKATVQAAIGGVALSNGLAIGTTTLAFAVLAILTTAPIFAYIMDLTYKKLLPKL